MMTRKVVSIFICFIFILSNTVLASQPLEQTLAVKVISQDPVRQKVVGSAARYFAETKRPDVVKLGTSAGSDLTGTVTSGETEALSDTPGFKDFTVTANEEDEFGRVSAKKVADRIVELQKQQRTVNLVLATGNTMVSFLHHLAEDNRIDWDRIHAFHLDEYRVVDEKGRSSALPGEHEASFAYFINKNFISRVERRLGRKLKTENIHYISDYVNDGRGTGRYMQDLADLGGADIIMLGIGPDGHLAFNEPSLYSSFDSTMQEVEVTESTIEANRPDYPGIVKNPYAYTMGMKDIINGRNIFFMARSGKKAAIVRKALEGSVTEDVPASILQTCREKVTVILDEDASGEISDMDLAGVVNVTSVKPPENSDIWRLFSELAEKDDIGLAIQDDFDIDRDIECALTGKGRALGQKELNVGIMRFGREHPFSLQNAVRQLRRHGKGNIIVLTVDADGIPRDIVKNPKFFENTLLFNTDSPDKEIRNTDSLRRKYQARILMALLVAASARKEKAPLRRQSKIQLLKYLIRPYMKSDSVNAIEEFIENLFNEKKDVIERFTVLIKYILSARPVRPFNKHEELEVLRQFWTFA